MCYAWLYWSLSLVFIQHWSTVALPGSCCLVRNSGLWQGLRWLNCLKLELSLAMQSNKSSKERDGAQKDKQIAFLQNSFSRGSFISKRQSERSRERHRYRWAESDTAGFKDATYMSVRYSPSSFIEKAFIEDYIPKYHYVVCGFIHSLKLYSTRKTPNLNSV